MTCSIKNFGRYTIAIDTVAPKCKPQNFVSGKALKAKEKKIIVKISDNLSGVSYYNAYLNGQWILAEYDGKSGRLIMDAKKLKQGTNKLTIKLSDSKSNSASFDYTITK